MWRGYIQFIAAQFLHLWRGLCIIVIDMTSERRETDYYAILNLAPDCSDAVIHEQYRRLVKVLHPDRNAGDEWCQEQLKLVNAAYAVLSDHSAKRGYDQRRSSRVEDHAPFVEELADHLVSEAAAIEERRKMVWLFDAAEHPLIRATDDSPMIEFVTQRSEVVCTTIPAIYPALKTAQPQTHLRPVVHPSKRNAYMSGLRTAMIICTALIALFGCAYIASPGLRSVVRPILHPGSRVVFTAQLRREGGA